MYSFQLVLVRSVHAINNIVQVKMLKQYTSQDLGFVVSGYAVGATANDDVAVDESLQLFLLVVVV